MRITRELVNTLERSEVHLVEALIRSARQRFSEMRPDAREIAGGIAMFAGFGSPLSEATGIGVTRSAGDAQAEEVTRFYEERGSRPRIRLSPLADPAFVRGLIARGYVPIEYENVLVADLVAIDEQRDQRVEDASDRHVWSRASAEGFAQRKPSADEVRVALLLCSVPEVIPLEIRSAGEIVATACMTVDHDVASFFAASTLPNHRARGLHRAMIADRMARAVEFGASIGRVTAAPASTSEQNFRRIGFVPVYTRTVWGKL